MSRVTLRGWGRTTPGVATVRHASNESEITATLESSTRSHRSGTRAQLR